MLTLVCGVFFVLGLSLSSGQHPELSSADQYMDSVIQMGLPEVFSTEMIEPVSLPDFVFEYTDNILGKISYRVEYKHGTLMGLSMVRRYSACDGPKNITGGLTSINCSLTFSEMGLMMSYTGEITYGNNLMHIPSQCEARDVVLRVGIVGETGKGKARLDSFGFVSLGSISIPIQPGPSMIRQMEDIEDNLEIRLEAEVVNVIFDRFQYGLNLAVAKVDMPVE